MAHQQPSRRLFVKAVAAAMPMMTAGGIESAGRAVAAPQAGGPLRLSCNLYSFNEPLMSGQMTLQEVLAFCSAVGFDAVDPTGYYFPGYPAVPDTSYLYEIKRRAFRLGLDISGTGVRNDFTLADPAKRKADIGLVKQWVDVSARLGAPVLRIFSGKGVPAGHTRETVTGWLVDALGECVDYSAKQGIILVLQNHADFIETADQLLDILQHVKSDWLAVNLDIGSFRIGDPYAQIARVAPLAATWQIKEKLFVDGNEVDTDLDRIARLVRASGYKGYLPIETLGKGDPRQKVPAFYNRVKKAMFPT
ncbi:sugar phosphate isomerase/epimerase family protein [Spirosoma sordidisoli]|uniref:Sugar phosphate isomerase/epimerase n=1 Tax=Spirosoma sordidisoli TaxID=2502893 RepID=A0A4Q2URS9_9BACT|nr:sugar phosphate isomerase/epimerase family protein [Spirosoma sordidisoli]RYC71742.1 sugar phosphate isomerase/epimerase [Spirosoma sordidisoli]